MSPTNARFCPRHRRRRRRHNNNKRIVYAKPALQLPLTLVLLSLVVPILCLPAVYRARATYHGQRLPARLGRPGNKLWPGARLFFLRPDSSQWTAGPVYDTSQGIRNWICKSVRFLYSSVYALV